MLTPYLQGATVLRDSNVARFSVARQEKVTVIRRILPITAVQYPQPLNKFSVRVRREAYPRAECRRWLFAAAPVPCLH
jgi:hypothetical protein